MKDNLENDACADEDGAFDQAAVALSEPLSEDQLVVLVAEDE